MQSFTFSQSPISEILNQLPSKLPVPFPTLHSMFSGLPYHLKTQSAYQQLNTKNMEIIEQHLSRLLDNCSSTIGNNANQINPNQTVQMFSESLRSYPLQGNFYADSLEGEGYQKCNYVANNVDFVNDLFINIANSHCRNYQCNPFPNSFYDIVKEKMNFLGTGGGQESGFFVPEKNQLENVIRAENQAKLLKEQLRASNIITHGNHNNMNNQNMNISQNKKLKNKIVALSQVGNNESEQGTIYETFSNSLYRQLNFYQFHTLNHFFTTITLDHLSQLQRFPYLQSAYGALEMAINDLKSKCDLAPQYNQVLGQAIKELQFGLQFYDTQGSAGQFYQIQSWIIMMVHIYKCVANSYTPLKRRILKLIFTSFSNQDLPNTIQVLRWLQNNRAQILSLNDDYNQVQAQASSLLLEIHNDRERILQQHNLDKIPVMRLILLSGHKPRRKTVNIWVSGFLSEDMSKDSQWGQLLTLMPDSQVYGLQWESDSIKNLIKFMGTSVKDIFTAKKMKDEIKRKFKDNPFNPAFEVAKYSGRYLAELIVRLFPLQFINIAGYSLGSELIKEFLERMIEIEKEGQISNIYMMGGVTDVEELRGIIGRAKTPLTVYNCYTGNDMVLKHILPMSKPDLKAIGISEIGDVDGHEILNIDCSDFISGHLAYMSNFDVVGKVLQMNEE